MSTAGEAMAMLRTALSSLALIGILGLAAGCSRCGSQPQAAGADAGAKQTDDSVSTAPAPEQQPAATPPAADAGQSRTTAQAGLVQQLEKKGRAVPGMAYELARIPEPTPQELAEPRLKNLPERTRRTVLIFQKLQAKAPQLYAPTKGPYDKIVDEKAWAKKRAAQEKKRQQAGRRGR